MKHWRYWLHNCHIYGNMFIVMKIYIRVNHACIYIYIYIYVNLHVSHGHWTIYIYIYVYIYIVHCPWLTCKLMTSHDKKGTYWKYWRLALIARFMEPIWGPSGADPGGPHVGSMNFPICVVMVDDKVGLAFMHRFGAPFTNMVKL